LPTIDGNRGEKKPSLGKKEGLTKRKNGLEGRGRKGKATAENQNLSLGVLAVVEKTQLCLFCLIKEKQGGKGGPKLQENLRNAEKKGGAIKKKRADEKISFRISVRGKEKKGSRVRDSPKRLMKKKMRKSGRGGWPHHWNSQLKARRRTRRPRWKW